MVWRYAHTGLENDGVLIDGADVWNLEWKAAPGSNARLPHPEEPGRILNYTAYEVEDEDGNPLLFAVAELSAVARCFYVWRER